MTELEATVKNEILTREVTLCMLLLKVDKISGDFSKSFIYIFLGIVPTFHQKSTLDLPQAKSTAKLAL